MHCLDRVCNFGLVWTVVAWVQHVTGEGYDTWHVGRVPPSRFEYDQLNGVFTPSKAKEACEHDLQCGGFTFKGVKDSSEYEAEVYFFHFVSDEPNSLKEYQKYPHWTTYIVGSRDYVVIPGYYDEDPDEVIKIPVV